MDYKDDLRWFVFDFQALTPQTPGFTRIIALTNFEIFGRDSGSDNDINSWEPPRLKPSTIRSCF